MEMDKIVKKLPHRVEIDDSEKWKIEDIYENDENWFTTISHENMGSIETESLKVVKKLGNIIDISKCISIRKKEI